MNWKRFATRCFATVVTLGLMLGTSLTVSAQTTLGTARKSGYIRVGFPNQVPYAYATDKGELVGADADVAREVVKRMGIAQMDGVLTEFGSLIPGLQARRFDIVLAMFINPKRCEQVAFSEPIYGIGQALVVKSGNPKNIRSYDDLVRRSDLKFGIMAGAVQAQYVKALNIPDNRVLQFPDGPSAIAAVATGRADAFGISSVSARRMVEAAGKDSGVELVVGFQDPVIQGKPARGYSAFAFRKEDEDLRVAFNAALKGLLGTPSHLEMISRYGFGKDNLPDRTTAELCQ